MCLAVHFATPEDSLDVVAVRIQDERGVVPWVMELSEAWLAVRLRTLAEGDREEVVDLLPAARREREMKRCKGWWRFEDAEVPVAATEAKGATVLDNRAVAERFQDRLVEPPRTIKFGDWNVDVIDDAHAFTAPSCISPRRRERMR